MNRKIKIACTLGSALFLAVAVLLPSQWYFDLPLPAGTERFPVSGIGLFRAAFVVEALILLLVSVFGFQYHQISEPDRLQSCPADHHASKVPHGIILLVVTLLAVALRFTGLSQSLWIDEITTVAYTNAGLFNQLTVFVSPNDHLLNTILIKLSIGLFGESEWSIRLPAVLFGIATVPVLYLVARPAVGVWPALAVCLLLSVSYHHVFFSQNARGYAAHLFLSLLATGLFLRGLNEDRLRWWVLYVVVMALNFVTLLNSIFVFLSHALVGLIAVYRVRRQGANILPLMRRQLYVFAILGLAVFHFYAIKIPQISPVISEIYSDDAAGYQAFSLEFLQELVRGVSAGFGAGAAVAALPFLLVAAAGFIEFAKRDTLLTMLLLLPGVITGMYLVTSGLAVSPRFFLFEIFLALICAIFGIRRSTEWLGRNLRFSETAITRVGAGIVILLAGLSAASLIYYYQTPKQAYRETVDFIHQTWTDNSKVIVFSTAVTGIAYYREKRQYGNVNEYVYIRDVSLLYDELEDLSDGHAQDDIYIVTTFHRALGISYPDVTKMLNEEWRQYRVFPATIGDGNIVIWAMKSSE